jgi:spore germination protein YaaH
VLPRAWARALCLTPFVLQLFVAPTAHASEPPAVHVANAANPSPTPAPDQSQPAAARGADAPAASQSRSGSTPAAQPLQTSTPLNTTANTLRREVFGFAYSGSLGDPNIGYPSWNFNDLSTVAFFAIHVQYDGQLVGDSNFAVWDSSVLTGLVNTAHAHGVKVVVTIVGPSNPIDQCDALYNGKRQTIPQLIQEVTRKGVDGVNIDYEGQLTQCQNIIDPTLNATNQTLTTNFARDMRAGLDAVKPGYYLSIDTYSGSALGNDGRFNIGNLNQYVDSFFVMTYDMDFANQPYPPLNCSSFCLAPVSPLANYYWNDTSSMTQYSALVGPGKTILGQPYYGTVACVASPADHATAISGPVTATYLDAASVAGSPDVQPGTFAAHRDDTDPNGLDRWDSWYDNKVGCWREMYWSDTVTLGVRYNLVNQMNLRGVGFWTLNYAGGSGELWSALATYFKSCYALAVNVQPASPAFVGTAVTLTATGGCPDPSPQYQFWVLAPGATSWQLGQAYSTTPAFNWSTAGLGAGSYRFSVWVRDANSTGISGNQSGTWDAYNNDTVYSLKSTVCSTLSASASPASPQAVGTSVTLAALAGNCPNPFYQFWVLPPGGNAYQLAQAYSSNASYTWSTSGIVPGTYRFSIWARDAGDTGAYGNQFGRWDTYNNNLVYTLTTCSSMQASASRSSQAGIGSTVTMSARALGCPDPNPLYQFWVLPPGGSAYQLGQAYSTSPNFSWSTAGLTPGTYRISIWARDANSSGAYGNQAGRWDAYNNDILYTLTTCSGLQMTVSPASPAAHGTSVTVTAQASGCPDPNPQYQFWVLAPGATAYQLVQAYSASSTFTWNTTGLAPGSYRFSVWVRDASSAGAQGNQSGTWDAYNNGTLYTLT